MIFRKIEKFDATVEKQELFSKRQKIIIVKATSEMLAIFDLPESQFSMMNRKFQELTTVRREFVRHNDMSNWEILPFYEHGACKPSTKLRSDGTDKFVVIS